MEQHAGDYECMTVRGVESGRLAFGGSMIKTLLQKIGVGAALMLVSSLVWAQAKYNLQEP
jgi:hypothetical protein